MRKLQGSLGFTLRKEDDSALGHYIRALVREPALTDARIRAGDKIIAVSRDRDVEFKIVQVCAESLRIFNRIVNFLLLRSSLDSTS